MVALPRYPSASTLGGGRRGVETSDRGRGGRRVPEPKSEELLVTGVRVARCRSADSHRPRVRSSTCHDICDLQLPDPQPHLDDVLLLRVRPLDLAPHQRLHGHLPEPRQQQKAFDAYVKQAAGSGNNVESLAKLADLKEKGVITDAEFQAEKTKLLA
ncbi:MAG: SHOCT domain-containing protein [Acidimicrobiales bacterium]